MFHAMDETMKDQADVLVRLRKQAYENTLLSMNFACPLHQRNGSLRPPSLCSCSRIFHHSQLKLFLCLHPCPYTHHKPST